MAGDFVSSAKLDVIRYSQVWEDHLLLEHGLDVGPGDDVLSIGSAGCNVLALLLREPRSITAIDASPAQIALMELKLVALRRLRHGEFVILLGARDGADRRELYARLRADLSPTTRAFWDAHEPELRCGPMRAGMLERYFRRFQELHLSRLVSPAAVRSLLDLDDPELQAELFEREFVSPEFEAAVRDYYGIEGMAGRARDSSQFRYVAQEDVAGFFWRRFRHACTAQPTRGNFYLEWFLTSQYRDLSAGPPYLRPQNYERLRDLAGRVTVVHDQLERHLDGVPADAYSKAALSDVFEYMSEEASSGLLEQVASRLRDGGRIAYWNLLVPRARPEHLADLLHPLESEASSLWARDRAFFYGAFHVDELRRSARPIAA